MADKPVVRYWGGVKSRLHYIQFTLAWNCQSDAIIVDGEGIPFPGAPGWEKQELSYMGQLPVMIHGDIRIGQSNAILRYLARLLKLYDGASDAQFALSEMLIDEAADIHAFLSGANYPADKRTENYDALFAGGGKIERHLKALEAIVGQNGSVFFNKEALPGDCAVAASLSLLSHLQPGVLDAFPKLKAMHETFQGNAEIKKVEETTPYMYFQRKSEVKG